MFIDTKKIRELLRNGELKRDTAKNNPDCMTELAKILPRLQNSLEEGTVEKNANWMLHKNLWLQNEDKSLSGFYNYSRGDIIHSLDLGTSNIGTEIRYPHPCVVLYDNDEDWVIVAPITSARLDETTKEPIVYPFEVLIRAQKSRPSDKKEFHFKKHSVIQVDQICRVSKHRAVNKNSSKVKEDFLNKIDNIILEYYLPRKHTLLQGMKKINTELQDKLSLMEHAIEELSVENQQYQETVSKQLQKIRELEAELQKLKDESLAG